MTDPFFNDLTRLSFSYVGNFSSLLPLGVLHLDSFRNLPSPAPTAPDGWNWAPPLPWITSRRGTLEADLEFLSSNDFIRATYKMCNTNRSNMAPQDRGKAIVRIYILAEDCEWYSAREQPKECKGRALLTKIWHLVDTSVTGWHGIPTFGRQQQSALHSLVDEESTSLGLSTIFNNLPSPQPDSQITAKTSPVVRVLLESVLEDEGVPGLKSELYQYQRESVWKMLQRELMPQKRSDPRLREWRGPTGLTSWINFEDMMFYRNEQFVGDVQGGILCEEMGTGKTCICLALILLTVHQRAQCPSGSKPIQPRPKTLFERCFNTVVNHGIPFKHLDPRPHFYNALEDAKPFYFVRPPAPRRARRSQFLRPTRKVYLSTSTLVVVPDTLIQQWQTEILKHVQDNTLNVLTISKPTQPIPTASELLKLDILLLSHSRFAKEDDEGRFEELHPCDCDDNCTCTNGTPLLRIYWKRLIIDEGHVLGQATTRLVSLSGLLRVERKWCVTGTVSNHMMGMDFGMERTLSEETGLLTPPDDRPSSSHSSSSISTSLSSNNATRKPEQLDLKRLGAIVIDFLQLPPFTNVEIWNRYVIRPYTDLGSLTTLKSVMTSMIRHSPRHIETDVRLPPLHKRTVLLTPTKENRISINVLTALIASNAVLTQRTDQDYFFHNSQVKFRDEVVKNLMLAAFQFTGPSISLVMEAIERSEAGLQKAEEKGYSKEDVELLERVVKCLREALDDEGWRTMVVRERLGKEDHTSQEMGFILEGCPQEMADAWCLEPERNPYEGHEQRTRHIFSGPNLLSILSRLPTLSNLPEVEHTRYLSEQGALRRRLAQEELEKERLEKLEKQRNKDGTMKKIVPTYKERSDEENKLRKVVQHELSHDITKPESPSKKKSPGKPKAIQSKLSSGSQLITPPSSPPDVTIDATSEATASLKPILKLPKTSADISETSPLKDIKFKRTTSAKLNYLLGEILKYYQEEKIIVFSDFGPSTWYLAEALEILGIKHLIYIQRISPQRRSQYIVTFNSSPYFRVLIMETKVAAHGLNVTAASRVFFLNPCWQRSTERQAIKRAHRIGQTREVFVETIVLKDTIEEELLNRREEMGKDQLDRTKKFLDDGKLRGIISSAKFVPEIASDEEEDGGDGFGLLFRARGEKDEEIERQVDIIADEMGARKKVKDQNKGKSVQIVDVEGLQAVGPPAKSSRDSDGKRKAADAGGIGKEVKKRRVMFAEDV